VRTSIFTLPTAVAAALVAGLVLTLHASAQNAPPGAPRPVAALAPAAAAPAADPTADFALAEEQFNQTCAMCHGRGAGGGDRAPSLLNTSSMRVRTQAQVQDVIKNGTPRGMPAFASMPEDQVVRIARWLRANNASAFETRPAGDVAAGEQVFFGKGECSSCHMVRGVGAANGPDLTTIGLRSNVAEINTWLDNPTSQMGTHTTASCPSWAFCPDLQWAVVNVQLKNGSKLRGFARNSAEHDLQLQTFDGKMHMLTDDQYTSVVREKTSYMPPLKADPTERKNLVAYLSSLGGVRVGALTKGGKEPTAAEIKEIEQPKRGDWVSYDGLQTGNRYSDLDQITKANVSNLALQWTFAPGGSGLQNTPVVKDGVMYVTGAAQVCALDARVGRSIWCTPRTRGDILSAAAAFQPPGGAGAVNPAAAALAAVGGGAPAPQAGAAAGGGANPAAAGRAAAPPGAPRGPNRGVAILGDKVFFTTDDAWLVALNRLTGAVVWSVAMPEAGTTGRYGTSASPLVVGDLVISGISGGDSPLRGFLAAYKASTGELVWRFWTIPKPGEPGSETWKGRALPTGGGATWTTGSYDPQSDTLYWAIGNPYPSTNGDDRDGDNLWTASVMAFEPKTGKTKWFYQFSPHDLHDWDANEPLVLADTMYKGKPRKLLMQANRNGFFFVLDRTDGKLLMAKPFVRKLTWASGYGEDGRPIVLPNNATDAKGVLTCPSVRGATNWYATSFNPQTSLFYVMAAEDCSVYRKIGRIYEGVRDPNDPGTRFVRALNIETGDIVWERPMAGAQEANYTGILSTKGGLIFNGETGGSFVALDAKTGERLWNFRSTEAWRASPMSYTVDGRQYVAVVAGSNVMSFALPAK
jgi:PQQ-dependent dehydrogenase (methanol/ethanol family)